MPVVKQGFEMYVHVACVTFGSKGNPVNTWVQIAPGPLLYIWTNSQMTTRLSQGVVFRYFSPPADETRVRNGR